LSQQKALKGKLQIRIDEELGERLAGYVRSQNMSISQAVRQMIEQGTASPSVVTALPKLSKKKTIPKLTDNSSKDSIVFSVGEMYSGPGGIGLAANRAKIESEGLMYSFTHGWATDYDSDTCQTYARNIGDGTFPVICGDIREVDIDRLPPVQGFMYGFPCNDFSLVGESKGLGGTFGPLYKYGVEYINKNNPLFILAENVSGLSSSNEGSAFLQIVEELGNAGKYGYELTVHLYKFEDYGVPQARHRIIVVGIRKDLKKKFQVPAPSKRKKTAREAIEKPPIKDGAPNNELTKQSPVVVERLSYIKPGENCWTANLPKRLQLNVKGAQLSQIYKRLDPDKPAYTITGSGGGGTHVYHWSENRALTNRERARLQTFPDNFVFVGSKESVRKQIGMAVPPAGAQIILEALLKTFAGEHYPNVPASFKSI
jgi:DNA (cytosine-5)-methyltransferase 1